jgi:hypothetical protein
LGDGGHYDRRRSCLNHALDRNDWAEASQIANLKLDDVGRPAARCDGDDLMALVERSILRSPILSAFRPCCCKASVVGASPCGF